MYFVKRLSNVTSILYTGPGVKCWFSKAQNGVLEQAVRSVNPQPQKQLQELVLADAKFVKGKKETVLKYFPNVKSTLHNMFQNLKKNLDESYGCQHKTTAIGRVRNKLVYNTNFEISWPRRLSFTGYGFRKNEAELNAMVKALDLLYNENLITLNGHPVTISQEEKQELLVGWNTPSVITVSPRMMENGWKLMDEFGEDMQFYLKSRNKNPSFDPLSHQEDSEDEQILGNISQEHDSGYSEVDEELKGESDFVRDLLTGREYVVDPNRSSSRSRELLERLSWRQDYPPSRSRLGKPLPILEYKDDLEKALDTHQVVVIAGDTGCGKSTKVPQMILDKWIKDGRGASCNILITQPRKISAISLAKCIARERDEKLGESIGFHVRLSYKPVKERGGIMFLTTGMLLQGLHSNPYLEGISHVIVDEVHERSVPTDMLLILLRRVINANKNLKIILMSASLSTEELQNYFGRNNSALIKVPGALYPLVRHFLPGVFSELNLKSERYQLQQLMEPGSRPVVNVDVIVDIIKAIDSNKPPGAILCFLPGWQDISSVQRRLQEVGRLKDKLWVLPLHSRLPFSEQEQIFDLAPSGIRKVVLATNIAETSLTVEDVVYVIDAGCHKEQRYDNQRDMGVLGNHWIAKANSQQRAGRAGRVQPGEVFHLYSDSVHESMNRFPVPEILRIPLEHVVLQCKAHCREESALSFLSDALSVPSPRLIRKAVKNLEDLGMLSLDGLEKSVENLTPLGRRVIHFSTPPHLSKALIYASIFKCVDSTSSIVAALCSGRGIFHNSIENRSEIRDIKQSVNSSSDLLAMLGLIHQWNELPNYSEKLNFCNYNNLSHRALLFNEGIKGVYMDHLRRAYMIGKYDEYRENTNDTNSQLLLGILLASVNRILLLQKGIFSKGILRKDKKLVKTTEGQPIDTGSDCVLHNIAKNLDVDSCHLLCINMTRDDTSRRTVARDLSILHPIIVVLFGGKSVSLHPSGEDYVLSVDGLKGRILFQVDHRTGNFLMELRDTVEQLVDIAIETRGVDDSAEDFKESSDKLVEYLGDLIKCSGSEWERNHFDEKNRNIESIYYDDEKY